MGRTAPSNGDLNCKLLACTDSPNVVFQGDDRITYKISDEKLLSSQAVISINVCLLCLSLLLWSKPALPFYFYLYCFTKNFEVCISPKPTFPCKGSSLIAIVSHSFSCGFYPRAVLPGIAQNNTVGCDLSAQRSTIYDSQHATLLPVSGLRSPVVLPVFPQQMMLK